MDSSTVGRFQLRTCRRCGKWCYRSRREARHAARVLHPGQHLRAYPCGDVWHFGHKDGRPPMTLFELPGATPAQIEQEVRTLSRRQADLLASGLHPLTLAFSQLPLHPEAAPHDDREAGGRRCGDCRFRGPVRSGAKSRPKCLFGDGVRVTHGAATDVRAWWSACPNHEWKPGAEPRPSCCRCDPAECEADDTGDHCATAGCAFCMEGCPSVEEPACCRKAAPDA